MFNRCELEFFFGLLKINDDSMYFPLEVDVFLEGYLALGLGTILLTSWIHYGSIFIEADLLFEVSNFISVIFAFSFVFSHALYDFLCSFTQTRIKVTDLSGTFWTGKELGLFSSSMKSQEISMPPRAWTGKRNRIMSCMLKPWIGSRRRPWSQSQSSSLKYKTSMIMHPNFQMDHS